MTYVPHYLFEFYILEFTKPTRALFKAIHYMTGFFGMFHAFLCGATKKYRKTLLQKCNRKSLWELVTESHFNVFFSSETHIEDSLIRHGGRRHNSKKTVVVVVIMLK